MKRLFLVLLVLVAGASQAFAAGGGGKNAPYPSRDITVVIGFATGGATDLTGRRFIEALGRQISDVNLVPTNMGGAGGTIGANHVYNAKPDGYTLFIAHPGIPVPYLRGNFDKSYKDFTPVASFADSNIVMFVHGESSYMTVDDIVQDAAARPGEVIMGASMGTLLHLASLSVEDHNGVNFKKVSVGGAQPPAPELLSRRIDTFLYSIAVGAPYVESGDFRALAVYGEERVPEFPDTPTFKELGYTYNFGQTFGLWAPPETPDEIVKMLAAAAEKACADPEFIKALSARGVRAAYRGPQEYKELLGVSFEELEKTAPLLKQ